MSNQLYLNESNSFSLTNATLSGALSSQAIRTYILSQSDFKYVVPGNTVFFRHVKTLIQYGIYIVQNIFGTPFKNVTHAGVVQNVTDRKVCIIEAVGQGLQSQCYSPEHLVKEDLCFPLSTEIFTHNLTKNIAEKIFEQPRGYNLLGALSQSVTPKIFTFEQKKRLIRAATLYLLNENPAKGKETYFCSEFALEVAQIARFLQKNPQLQELVDQEMSQANLHIFGEKEKAIRRIIEKLDVDALWKIVAADPLFATPALATSPADLIGTYAKSGPIICVSPSDPETSPCNSTHASESECLEYMAVSALDRYVKGEEISEDELQTSMSSLSKVTSYSPETLRCFFQQARSGRCSNPALGQCLADIIEDCLNSTLSVREKINVFFVSCAFFDAADQLKKKPSLIDRLLSQDNAVVEEATRELFPTHLFESKYFLTNRLFVEALKRKDPEYLYKYIPIGLLYDRSIFERFKEIGVENIYPFLEKLTSIDHQIFECWHKICNLKFTLNCAASCLKPEKNATMTVASNIGRELDKIRKNRDITESCV